MVPRVALTDCRERFRTPLQAAGVGNDADASLQGESLINILLTKRAVNC
jgi:hypothetical protein